jgi:hypothetical protein
MPTQLVANVMGQLVTRGQLSAVFDTVADKSNWKKADRRRRRPRRFRQKPSSFLPARCRFTPRVGAKLPKCRYRIRAAVAGVWGENMIPM